MDRTSGEMNKPVLTRDNTAVIACGMLRTEIEHVYRKNHLDYPIRWIKKGMHEYPGQLKAKLEAGIEAYQDKTYVILVYGMCGLAPIGLKSAKSTLAIPKFDDCIRILMCREKGEPIPTGCTHFYFTREWVDSDKFMLDEFDRYIASYGEETGHMLIDTMIDSYEAIDMIDDGTYDAKMLCEKVRPRAAGYGLSCGCVKGTTRVLEKLLLGDWDEEIVVNLPGCPISMTDFADRPKCIL